MAAYEWTVVAYFAGLTLAAWLAGLESARRRQATALGVAIVLTVFGVAATGSYAFRAWVPHLYLFAGYWLPALLVSPTHDRLFEAWLVRSDTTLRGWLPAVPAPFVPLLEGAYLLCYPLVPISFSIVWFRGGSIDVERFWLAILLSGYACYISLPWLVSRPPRTQQRDSRLPRGVRSFNERVLARWSHQFNTFPSGHVAVAAAAAVAAGTVSTQAGFALGAIVAGITVGAAAGGYHYVVDVILGLIVAAAAVEVAGLL